MFRIWIASSLLVAAACVSREFIDVKDVKEIISKAGDYLGNHYLTQIDLPSIGLLPLEAVKLRNGVLQGFQTIRSKEDPVLIKKHNFDHSITYQFFVKLGLDRFNIHYDFEMGPPGYVRQQTKGFVHVQSMDNELLVSGTLVLGVKDSCDVMVTEASVIRMHDNIFTIGPKNIPEFHSVSNTVRSFIKPKLVAVTLRAFNAVLQNPWFQDGFAEFVCKQVTRL